MEPEQNVLQLLDEQYQAVEEYANAQTALYNALHSKQPAMNGPPDGTTTGRGRRSPDSSPPALLRAYRDAVVGVQESIRKCRELPRSSLIDRGLQRAVQQHVERMSAILESVGGQPLVHPNGVPAKTIGPDDFLIALSATRASIRVVQAAVEKTSTGNA